MSDHVEAMECSVDLMKSLLWQHDNAEHLKSLIEQKQKWYNENHCGFWRDWYRDVFNLDTANSFGLSVWSRILNIPLQVQIDGSANKPAFGFGVNHQNFNNGNFARARDGEQALNEDQARLVLKLRYLQLISNGTVPQINEWLSDLFSDLGRVFVVDNHDMTATYFFEFEPSAQLKFILEKYDILPRPAAVGINWQVQIRPSFGFGENHFNFNNGSFGA